MKIIGSRIESRAIKNSNKRRKNNNISIQINFLSIILRTEQKK